MRLHSRRAIVGALAATLAASGIAIGATPGNAVAAAQAGVAIDFAGTTPVPAPPVPGAQSGGQLTWLQDGAPGHLDPQQIYDVLDLSTQLFFRTLTGYIEDPAGGQLRLVGDLATNAGEPSDGGKVWTYHLRPGITFEDGTPIKAADVAYGIARSFSQYGTFGPHYFQFALDPSGTYAGPYGGQDLPPGVTTPDDQTLVFTFAAPHPEMPYIAALPTTTPVPKARDTQDQYETTWVASGPYRRQSTEPGVSLVLERNPNWNPATDPIRHQYADMIRFDWTADRAEQTDRVIAGTGADATALMTANVAADRIDAVRNDPVLAQRTLAGPTPTAKYININTSRVTNVNVRRALNYAFDRGALVDAQGGSAVADPSTTILAPTVPGYLAYNAYPAGAHGNVTKARQLLQGRKPLLNYCFQDTTDETQQAQVVRVGLERAGFRITMSPLDASSYWSLVGSRSTTCDLITSAWVADFPDADSTLRVLLDGNLIGDEGNINFSYFNEPCVNTKLEQLASLADRSAAAAQYGPLDHEIMANYAPLIPTVYARAFLLHGPHVGGVFLSGLFGRPNLTGAYATS